jgi:hypothetical protein
MTGGLQGVATVTVAVVLSAGQPPLEARTQYAVVTARGGVVYVADVAPAIGLETSPERP